MNTWHKLYYIEGEGLQEMESQSWFHGRQAGQDKAFDEEGGWKELYWSGFQPGPEEALESIPGL